MILKTVTVQLHKPGARKSELLLLTMTRYAQALQYLLSRYHPAVDALREESSLPSRPALVRLIEKDALRELNRFEMQPFKDSLKIDFAALAAGYLSLSRTRPASYPCVFTEDQDLEGLLSLASPSPKKLSSALAKYHTPRALLFGRCDRGRDFCLLRDELRGRYYAKLYLFSASGDSRKTYRESRRLDLRYTGPGGGYLETRKQKERYLIFPIACGADQKRQLDEACARPRSIRSARLSFRDGKFYLAVSIARETPEPAEPRSLLAVSRGTDCLIHMSLASLGEALAAFSGAAGTDMAPARASSQTAYRLFRLAGPDAVRPESIRVEDPAQSCDGISRLHIMANEIIRIASENQSLILFESQSTHSLADYTRLCSILTWKAAEKGLPRPIALSPRRLGRTCPSCGSTSTEGGLLPGLMICTRCGYSVDRNTAGSLNLIRRYVIYRRQTVVFDYSFEGGAVLFENRVLGAAFRVARSEDMEQDFYAQLESFIGQAAPREQPFPYDGTISRQKYGLLRKLRAADPLSDAVSFAEAR